MEKSHEPTGPAYTWPPAASEAEPPSESTSPGFHGHPYDQPDQPAEPDTGQALYEPSATQAQDGQFVVPGVDAEPTLTEPTLTEPTPGPPTPEQPTPEQPAPTEAPPAERPPEVTPQEAPPEVTPEQAPPEVAPDQPPVDVPPTAFTAGAASSPPAAGEVTGERELGPTGRPWPNLPEPRPVSGGHGPAMIVAMCNQKGGVGKTTTTINLGAALVETGRKVLLVDFDPQGSLSVGLGVNPHTLELSIYNLLLGRDTDVDEVIAETNVEGLDILPSNIDLSAAEVQLVSEVAREQTLLRVLERVKDRYDVILVDCAPSLGLLTVNALTAADKVIMPLECEFFALRGIALLTDTISKVQDRLNPGLEILGILGTMYDPRTLHSREVLERVVQAFGETVFHTVIRRTVKFPETTVAGEPITTYATTSPGAAAYRSLAREVLARCHVG